MLEFFVYGVKLRKWHEMHLLFPLCGWSIDQFYIVEWLQLKYTDYIFAAVWLHLYIGTYTIPTSCIRRTQILA